jgi:GntR family transcriptional regulator / MocR family aminotransferase
VLSAGSRLPSSRVLAQDVGVSRGVVSRVYAQLAFEGYIVIRQGSVPTVRAISPVESIGVDREERTRLRYDLRAHLPEVSTFPRRLWLRSVRDSLGQAKDADLSYGDPAGLHELRAEIAKYLSRARGVTVAPEHVVITSGSTHSLSLIARALLRRGSRLMAFENPSHYLLREIAHAAGQEIVAVPVDGEGVIARFPARATAVVVSPAHQFPTGVTLSPERREDLLAWAAETGSLIIEDDYDAEFRYDRAAVGALQGLAPDRVVYMGSTGKTFVPALRLGWAVVPDDLRDDVLRELSLTVLQVSGMDQLAFADFLRRGEFDRHLRHMRDVYRKRRDVLVAALGRALPDMPVRGIAAGLHVVLEMPSHEIAESVRARALAAGVAFETTAQHTFSGYRGPAGLILGFGAVAEPGLEVAARVIARVTEEECAAEPAEESAA